MDNFQSKRSQMRNFVDDSVDVHISATVTVADVMTAEPECLSIDVTALDLVRRFHATGYRHLLIADEQNRLAGVVSDRDVIRCYGVGNGPSSDELKQIRASDLMSTDLITVESTTPLHEAVGLLVDNGISCLPVVDRGNLLGILTNTDLYLLLQGFLAKGGEQASEPVAVVATV
jgi:CBS domain-containing protein